MLNFLTPPRFHPLHSARLLQLLVLIALAPRIAPAQNTSVPTVPVLLLSDIHLDPFHDPAKLPQLLAAPATAWAAILDATPSPTQSADFARLQATCNARGVDTPSALFHSALQAARQQQPHPLFVTVSGDLLAHQFDCRFHTLAPAASPSDYSAFAAKTVAFVALQLHLTFPHSPIDFALGNNDSGCHDYSEDPDSAFLHADALTFAADALSPANSAAILNSFPTLGDYTLTLPAPIQHTRLIVLQDIFQSKRYTACNSTSPVPALTPAADQISWLRAQLTAARADHQHVWVMAHIPPGIDAYSTFAKRRNVCAGQSPEMFLSSDAFATTLADFPDIIRLVLLGHTHMDEFRVYTSANADPIPAKLVPSITPVNGNNPAFTLADIDPSSATLKDYAVYGANNQTGDNTRWSEEYRYSTTYHLPDLSGASLANLTSSFLADKSGNSDLSHAYQNFFYVGAPGISASIKAAAMRIVWPAYACALTSDHAAGFRSCVCNTPSQ